MNKTNNFEHLANEICVILKVKTPLGLAAARQMLSNLVLLDQKNQDYGSANLEKFGSHGVLVRLSDKVERMANLSKKSTHNFESVGDSWQDAANYGLIGQILHTKEQAIIIEDNVESEE